LSETTLGERITRILRERRLKSVEFAKALGIGGNYVSQLINGRKRGISVPLAKLIETVYAFRAEWVLTGAEPVYPPDALSDLRENTLEEIKRIDSGELKAVAAYLRTLNDVGEEAAPAPDAEPEPQGGQDRAPSGNLSSLSKAERRVYDLRAQGYNARKVAETLGLSLNTVNTHSRHIFKKLGVKSQRELAGYGKPENNTDRGI